MGASRRFQEPGDCRVQASGERRDDDGEEDVRNVSHAREVGSDPDAGDDADEVLALAADVEEAATERERDREARQGERRREDQHLLEVVGVVVHDGRVPPEEDVGVRERDVDVVVAEVDEPRQPCAGDDSLVDLPRVVARRRDDDAAHQEREQGGDHGDDDSAGTLPDREVLGDARRVGGW